MPARKTSRRSTDAGPHVFTIPNAADYSRAMYDAMANTQALFAGLPYQSGTEPAPKPDAVAPLRGEGGNLPTLFDTQTRFMQSLWQAWFEMPARFWESWTKLGR